MMTIVIGILMGGCANENKVKQQSMQGSDFMEINTNGAQQATIN